MSIRERLEEAYPDEKFLFADGYDAALIGVSEALFGQNEGQPRLVYSVTKVLAILRDQLGPAPDPEEGEEPEDEHAVAREFFDVNIAGSYVGPQTPIWCEDEFTLI